MIFNKVILWGIILFSIDTVSVSKRDIILLARELKVSIKDINKTFVNWKNVKSIKQIKKMYYQNIKNQPKIIDKFSDVIKNPCVNDIFFDEPWVYKLFSNNKIKNVLEIGCNYGLSTAFFANVLSEKGKVYVIKSGSGFMQYLDSDTNIEQFKDTFMSVIGIKIFNNKVVLIDKKPKFFEYLHLYSDQIPFSDIDFVYIHSSEDSVSLLRNVSGAGASQKIVCGDDWCLPLVKNAIRTYAQKEGFTIYADDNFWFLKKEDFYCEKSFMAAKESVWCFNLKSN